MIFQTISITDDALREAKRISSILLLRHGHKALFLISDWFKSFLSRYLMTIHEPDDKQHTSPLQQL